MKSKSYNSIPVEVANRIRDTIILEQKYKPNEKIPTEFELAEELEVSRNSVREAVKILVANNVLVVKRGIGTFVSAHPNEKPDVFGISLVQDAAKLYNDWFVTRLALEPEIAYLAAQNATEEEIQQVREWERKCAELIRQGEPYYKEDGQFHVALAVASHNSVIERIMPMLSTAVERVTEQNHSENAEATKNNALYYHDHIVTYIEKRSPETARVLMRSHLQVAYDQFLKIDMAKR